MSRTILPCLLSALAAIALVACGTDDSKGASSPQPSSTSAAETAKAPAQPKEEPRNAKPSELSAPDKGMTDADSAMGAKDAKSAAAHDDHAGHDHATHDQEAAQATAGKDAGKPAADPAIANMREFIESKKIDKSVQGWRTTVPMPPKLTFDPDKKYFWMLNTTEGPIKVRLLTDVAPMHVSSTIYLTEMGFYDGLAFHRVIPNFMAQGGDPLGTGTGGPGYTYAGEISPKATHSKPGILSMANTGRPSSDGSQFFLTFVPTPHLDGKHTVFGEVVDGLDNVKKLEKFGSGGGATSKPLKIETAKIVVE